MKWYNDNSDLYLHTIGIRENTFVRIAEEYGLPTIVMGDVV